MSIVIEAVSTIATSTTIATISAVLDCPPFSALPWSGKVSAVAGSLDAKTTEGTFVAVGTTGDRAVDGAVDDAVDGGVDGAADGAADGAHVYQLHSNKVTLLLGSVLVPRFAAVINVWSRKSPLVVEKVDHKTCEFARLRLFECLYPKRITTIAPKHHMPSKSFWSRILLF